MSAVSEFGSWMLLGGAFAIALLLFYGLLGVFFYLLYRRRRRKKPGMLRCRTIVTGLKLSNSAANDNLNWGGEPYILWEKA